MATNQWLYRLMYWLGRSPWDTGITPPEVHEAFQAGDIPPGAALDLGCGTGTNVIFMARQGRQAIGIDFVPAAIARAREKARRAGVAGQTCFHLSDVTRLAELDLPACGFALDMGCFHGIEAEGQRHYAAGLAAVLVPGGRFMLYTLDPRRQARITFGMSPEQVQAIFASQFEFERTQRDLATGSTWFWMKRM
jgi:cyclopropane fatty-acyl-phospholipid synthase-like methyltransferase